jgi:hypothetical protein
MGSIGQANRRKGEHDPARRDAAGEKTPAADIWADDRGREITISGFGIPLAKTHYGNYPVDAAKQQR